MFGMIQSISGAIDKMPVIGNQGFIGKHLLFSGQTNKNFGNDAVSWLRNTPKTNGFFNRVFRVMFPAPIRPALAKAVSGFSNLPLMKRVSIWAQYGLAFDAVGAVYSTLKSTLKGYEKPGGDLVSGVQAGVKTFMQSAAMMTATLVGSFVAPALLRISVLTPSGIIAGIVGGSIMRQMTEKFIKGPQKSEEALKEKPLQSALLKSKVPSPEEIVSMLPVVNTVANTLPIQGPPVPQLMQQPNASNPFMFRP